MIKYPKIKSKKVDMSIFENGYVVMEKLDGANASLTIENGELVKQSRRTVLKGDNTLRGFAGFVDEWYEEHKDDVIFGVTVKEFLETHVIYGEWLVRHTVKYDEQDYGKFYVFDILYKESNEFVPVLKLLELTDVLSLTPILENSEGQLEGDKLRTLNERVDKTETDLEHSKVNVEGFVVKPLGWRPSDERYNAIKIVSDKFKETSKSGNGKKGNDLSQLFDFAFTDARLEKSLYKAIDEGNLSEEDLVLEDKNFGKIMKNVSDDYVNDILEEENDKIMKHLRKSMKKRMAEQLREYLSNRSEVE